jgi:hypothetical protein
MWEKDPVLVSRVTRIAYKLQDEPALEGLNLKREAAFFPTVRNVRE